MKRAALLLAVLVLTATPAAAATARASGVLSIHTGPGDFYRTIDKLGRNERVELDQCTRHSRWCHIIQLDGGPSGWVAGDYLVGSPAKNAVTPFEFSFNPLDPLDLRHRRLDSDGNR
jgi:uncharacterized protein YraI